MEEIKLCNCGCGRKVKYTYNAYLWGHNTHSRKKILDKINCLNCNKEFVPVNKTRKYCSVSCKALHQFKISSPWNKGTKGLYKTGRAGLSYDDYYGIKKSKIIRKKMSIAKKDIKYTKGRHHSEETKKLLSKIGKLKWAQKDYVEMMIKAQRRKPNNQELIVNRMLNKNFPKEWKYVGDGKFWINKMNPDFVNINGKKVLIEYNGYLPRHTKEFDRKRTREFAKFGWKTINVYFSEIKNEEMFVKKIKNFMLDIKV